MLRPDSHFQGELVVTGSCDARDALGSTGPGNMARPSLLAGVCSGAKAGEFVAVAHDLVLSSEFTNFSVNFRFTNWELLSTITSLDRRFKSSSFPGLIAVLKVTRPRDHLELQDFKAGCITMRHSTFSC
jgi:hypothetical protein